MALIKSIRSEFDCSESIGIMDNNEDRHFCYVCRKLIRNGEKFLIETVPAPFTRSCTKLAYRHYPGCQSSIKNRKGE